MKFMAGIEVSPLLPLNREKAFNLGRFDQSRVLPRGLNVGLFAPRCFRRIRNPDRWAFGLGLLSFREEQRPRRWRCARSGGRGVREPGGPDRAGRGDKGMAAASRLHRLNAGL